jgi:hypothetical protein
MKQATIGPVVKTNRCTRAKIKLKGTAGGGRGDRDLTTNTVNRQTVNMATYHSDLSRRSSDRFCGLVRIHQTDGIHEFHPRLDPGNSTHLIFCLLVMECDENHDKTTPTHTKTTVSLSAYNKNNSYSLNSVNFSSQVVHMKMQLLRISDVSRELSN